VITACTTRFNIQKFYVFLIEDVDTCRVDLTTYQITSLDIPRLIVTIQEFNLLKPTGHVMHHQFNIQQLYALPTLYLDVLYLSENKQRGEVEKTTERGALRSVRYTKYYSDD
jgi:hypothetical protein